MDRGARELVIQRLRESASFDHVAPDALLALAYVMRCVQLADGDTLFVEGDQGADAYLVLEGEIEILGRATSGTDRVRAVLAPGELFGELALFGDGRRNAGARARGARVVLAALAFADFVEVIRVWPDIALAMMRIQARRFLALERDFRQRLDS